MSSVLHDDATFEAERRRLVGLAYRITGSRAEADDIVQDAWLRWQRADPATVDRPAAWLTTVTSRLSLDRLKSARAQRESYVGPWLPDAATTEPGPADHAELAESLTMGFLAVLERLGPTERVVFLLADVFALPFDEIAAVVDKTPEACRQVASRARKRVRQERPRFAPTDDEAWQVTAAFLTAAQAGDLDSLVSLLAEDAVAVSDGGAEHHAARRPVAAERIPRFIVNLAARLTPQDVITARLVNGQPGIHVERPGATPFAMAFSVAGGLVDRIFIVVNPAKVAPLDAPPVG
ncbi:sigma-70 family RNA polymerase sigma factor [soil metagenome]